MKVIGYCRVSTEGQASDGVSLSAQESKIRAWADLKGADSVEIFVDAGISGRKAKNRPALQEALDSAEDGSAFVVYSFSRLARSTKDTLWIAELLNAKGADLVSVSENIDTTSAAGDMIFKVLAVMSEFESKLLSERTMSALSHKRDRGEKLGGDVPFGFRVRGGKLYPHKREQEAIGLICRLKGKGYSLRAICAELETEGFRTKTGKKQWNPKTVSSIIKREVKAA